MLLLRSRRSRIRQWIVVLNLEAIVVVIVCVLLRTNMDDPQAHARESIDATVEQINLISQSIAASQEELQMMQQRLAVSNEVSKKPDWSILLKIVASSGKNIVALDTIQLMPPVYEPGTDIKKYRIVLLGTCKTRRDLTRFVQSLEATRIIDSVNIAQTQSHGNISGEEGERIGFSIEAWLLDGDAS